jgi:hypothetical protein
MVVSGVSNKENCQNLQKSLLEALKNSCWWCILIKKTVKTCKNLY